MSSKTRTIAQTRGAASVGHMTLPTFAPDLHTTASDLTDAQAIALDWITAKEIENAAKDAEKIRKNAGILLRDLIGVGGTVTVNRGGFRRYVLKVTPNKGRVSADKVLAQLITLHPELAAEIETLSEASRNPFDTIALKDPKV